MATRKGRSAGSALAAAENAPTPAPAPAPKGGKKKSGLSEKPVNVKKPLDMEEALAALTAKLEDVTIQKERTEVMLKEKDNALQQSEEERAKLQRDMAKLQKQKAKSFNPELNVELLKLVVKEDEAEGAAAGEESEKKEKRDPRKPKKPLSAYLLWSQEVKSQQPKGQADTSKNLAEQWKALPEAQKQKYNQAYQASMATYNASMEAYEKMLEEEKRKEAAMALLNEQKAKAELAKLAQQFLDHAEEKDAPEAAKKKGSKEKDPEKPKQPMTAFLYFCNDRRKAFATAATSKGTKRNTKEESAIMSEEWNKIKDNEKARKKYDALAAADRKRFDSEMEAYKARKHEEEEALKAESAKQEEEELEEAMKLLSAKEAKSKRSAGPALTAAPTAAPILLGEPAAPVGKAAKGKKGPSGYNLFQSSVSDSFRKAEPGITLGDLSRRLGQAWKDLSAEERSQWNAKAEAMAPAIQPVQPNDSSADFGL